MDTTTTPAPAATNPWKAVRPGLDERLVHATGSGHKVHHARDYREGEGSKVWAGRSDCGSERFGTHRNGTVVAEAITCRKCRPIASCAICAATTTEG